MLSGRRQLAQPQPQGPRALLKARLPEQHSALLKRGEDGEEAGGSGRRWVRLNPLATLLRTEARDQRAQEDEQDDDGLVGGCV